MVTPIKLELGLVPGATKAQARKDGTIAVGFIITIEGVGVVGGQFDPVAQRFYWPEKYGDKLTCSDEFESQVLAILATVPKVAALLKKKSF